MKKQLVISIAAALMGVISLFLLIQSPFAPIVLLFTFLTLIIAIYLICLLVKMIGFLGRAKNLSGDQLLITAYNLTLGQIILRLIGGFIANFIGALFGLFIDIIGIIITIIIIKNIIDYIFKATTQNIDKNAANSLEKGYSLTIITSVIQIVLSVVGYIIMDITIYMVILVISLLIAIIGTYAQFQIANGIIAATSPYTGGMGGYGGYGATSPGAYRQSQMQPNYENVNNYSQYETQRPPQPSVFEYESSTTRAPQQSNQSGEYKGKCEFCQTPYESNQKYCAVCGAPVE